MPDLESLSRKFALQNALEHEGKASPGPVIGRIMNEMPEMKTRAREVSEAAREAITRVNAMDQASQRAELERLAPELLVKKRKEVLKELPPLEGGEKGVVMRLAPNPSGPLHIGHTRMAILNDEYVKRYGGKLIVRMEDTNPPTVMPEAYDMICHDLDWLEVEYHQVVNQSSGFDVYYEHAEKILALGKGYMCSCKEEEWRELKDKSIECPHRNTGPDANVGLWRRMLAGEFKAHEISMVVKTDIKHPNPAVRDFVAMRRVDEPHPLTGEKYKIYPLYNFSVAVDDHLMGMTHVLRGKDHLNNTLRQEYVYEHMGWKKPVFLHYGWVSIEDTILSTRQIKAAIKEGKYSGWDDPRLGTVAALARRGFHPGAIRRYWKDVGAKAVDIKFSWDNLYAYNKEIILPNAKRFAFVSNPETKVIENVDEIECYGPYHPDFPDLGTKREILKKKDGKLIIFASNDDFTSMPAGNFRFKDFVNVHFDGKRIQLLQDEIELVKDGIHIVSWVPEDALDVAVHMPDGKKLKGKVQKEIANEHTGSVVELKKFGFVRLEFNGNELTAIFTHK